MRTIFRSTESRSDVNIWEVSIANITDGVAIYVQKAGSQKPGKRLICFIDKDGITLMQTITTDLPVDKQGFLKIVREGGR